VKLNEIEMRMPAWYESSCQQGGPTYCLTGPPGRGKTAVIKRFKKRMKQIYPDKKFGLAYISGPSFTLTTGSGYLVTSQDARGRMLSTFTLPPWYFDMEDRLTLDNYDGGVILVDDYDKMGGDEKKLISEACYEKRLANHYFSDGWVMWLTMNRLTDRSGSTRDFDHAINRRIEIPIRDDVDAWVSWARSEKILPEVITFAEENVQLLFEPKPEDQRPWCTPRSLHQSNIHLCALMSAFGTDQIPVDPMVQEEVAGSIGVPASAALFKTIRLGQELATYDEVVANPDNAAMPTKPDGKRLMAYKLADKVGIKDAPQVLQYMTRMEQEFQVIFVRMASTRNFRLIMEPTFSDWCSKNNTLIAILNRFKNEET
jgi:hypothetical protein